MKNENRNTNQRTAPPIKTKHAFVSERYSYCRKWRNTDKFCPPLLLTARFTVDVELVEHDAKAVYKTLVYDYTTYDNSSLTFQMLRFIIPVLPVCLS